MTDPTPLRSAIPARLADALNLLVSGALRAATYALEQLPPDERRKMMQLLEDGSGGYTVQIDLPSGEMRVMADAKHFAEPVVLLACEHQSPIFDRIGG
jgi:hypothetical protein